MRTYMHACMRGFAVSYKISLLDHLFKFPVSFVFERIISYDDGENACGRLHAFLFLSKR